MDLLSFVTIARSPRRDNTLGTTLLTCECVNISPSTASLYSSVVQASTTAQTVTVSGVDATTAAELCRCSVHHSPTTCLGSAVAGFGVYAAKAAQLSPYVVPLGSTARVHGTGSGEDMTLAAQLGPSVV